MKRSLGAEIVDADVVRDGKITARAAALSIPFALRLVEARPHADDIRARSAIPMCDRSAKDRVLRVCRGMCSGRNMQGKACPNGRSG